MKRLFPSFLLIAALIFILPIATYAADKPTVTWPHSSVNATTARPDSLVDEGVLTQVSMLVNERLHTLDTAEKLPFTLQETATDFTEDVTENSSITLIPLVMDDHVFKSSYWIDGVTYHKAVVMTQIDIAFCYYSGSGNSLRILHVIPLTGYAVIGNNGEYTTPISKTALQQQFITNASQLIQQRLAFKNKNFLKDLDFKAVTPDTYQVTQVTISSPAAQQFYGPRLPLAEALVATAFTSEYAATHPDRTVLPAVVGAKWQEDAAKKTYQLSLGDTGKYLVMERANHEIALQVPKVGAFNIPIKNDSGVYKKKGYTAVVTNETDHTSGTAVVQKTVLAKTNPNQVKHDLAGILAELLTETAKNAAQH